MAAAPSHIRINHRVINALLVRRFMPITDLLKTFFHAVEEEGDNSDKRKYTLKLCIDDCNGPLLKLGFKISMCFSEACGGTFYCLVNTLDDHIARAVKPLDDWRYDQLKVFLGKIIESDEGWLPLSEAHSLKPPGKPTAQDWKGGLESLQQEGWIMVIPGPGAKARVVPGVRAWAELETDFVSNEAVRKCETCGRKVIYGVEGADRRFTHLYCAADVEGPRGGGAADPLLSTPFEKRGELALDVGRAGAKAAAGGAGGRRLSSRGAAVGGGAGSDDPDSEPQASGSAAATSAEEAGGRKRRRAA